MMRYYITAPIFPFEFKVRAEIVVVGVDTGAADA